MNDSGGPGLLPEFTKEHLEEHYRCYPAAHLMKIKEIEARLLKTDMTCADTVYCPIRSLKKEYSYAINSVKMHDYYFENIDGAGSKPSLEMLNMLERDFHSLEEWGKQFTALAMCSRGWAVLGFDLNEGVLRNLIADDHSEGVWMMLPLLVLDVYEHAYCHVYPSRSAYVESFLKCVRWEVVSRRLKAAREIFRVLTQDHVRAYRY